ncbi:Tfp pilus assembly protein FimT/FimU [[Limnothrix rosea] IAM M-220]|uniref:pilus assembly FimT family protein n=1 Tax=[Limnothrix rosea] IAM M-220 TaxID=454133 RepID=UPI000960E5A1|nr:type II secretion system protein [[Limnothrix rosea] IAM M-220]OKH12913.1 hypothetical protein NIES208_15580 [[Limnothrix rosea] IAM M-220]
MATTGDYRGFTLVEILVVMLMVGVMAAIASPGVLGFLARAKVNRGLSRLQEMILLTQRNAMRISQSCTMFLPENNSKNGILTSNCGVTGNQILEDVRIKYNRANSKKVNFNYRGNTGSLRTIVIYSVSTDLKRCMVISNGIGMTRTGVYTRNDLENISANFCQTSL